ncbi:membrane protein of unknown function [Candidatus Promineifilum breve]|uniref:Uncharacterized protein n=1 Tax=Candidatus Promineifilum breve TaxID=1806508 RepID=A0A170PGZ2_9CHLR|nr:tetratricopeptide repeat protein [Candidatus Promineifilum breve]CUS04023.2 membrane protein of unknown function [Candidatus Promineifilum breve]
MTSPRLRGEDPYEYMVSELSEQMSWNTLMISDDIANLQWNVTNELQALSGTVQRGLSDISWRLEQQRQIFQEINSRLAAPMTTAARELRDRGLDYYQKEWYDNALDAFRESLKLNPTDFVVHHTIGDIHLFHIKDLPEALKHFELGAKYARPESLHYSAYSLVYKARTQHEMGDTVGAYQSVIEAVRRDGKLAEAHYSIAQYGAKLGHQKDAARHLGFSIQLDPHNYERSDKDNSFDSMRSDVRGVQKLMLDYANNVAKSTIDDASKVRQQAVDLLASHYAPAHWEPAENDYIEAQKGLASGIYLRVRQGILAAYQSIPKFQDVINNALLSRKDELLDALNKRHQELQDDMFKRQGKGRRSPMLGIVAAAGYLIAAALIWRFYYQNVDSFLALILMFIGPTIGVFGGVFIASALYRLRGQPEYKGPGIWIIVGLSVLGTLLIIFVLLPRIDPSNEFVAFLIIGIVSVIWAMVVAFAGFMLTRKGLTRADQRYYESLFSEVEQSKSLATNGQIHDLKQIPKRLKVQVPG